MKLQILLCYYVETVHILFDPKPTYMLINPMCLIPLGGRLDCGKHRFDCDVLDADWFSYIFGRVTMTLIIGVFDDGTYGS